MNRTTRIAVVTSSVAFLVAAPAASALAATTAPARPVSSAPRPPRVAPAPRDVALPQRVRVSSTATGPTSTSLMYAGALPVA